MKRGFFLTVATVLLLIPLQVGAASETYGIGGEAFGLLYDISPYNNAIFTGAGAVSEDSVTGNFRGRVDIAGSIYSRGTLKVGSKIHIVNNYQSGYNPLGPGDILYDLINQETDLETRVHVKGGDLVIESAAMQIGAPGADNAVAGVYVDGYTNAFSVGTHYVENWSIEVPDIPFPSIFDGLAEVFDNLGEDFRGCIATKSGANDAAIATSIYADWATGTGCFSASPGRGGVADHDILIDRYTPSTWLVGPDTNGNGMLYISPGGQRGMGRLTIQGTVVVNGDFTFGDEALTGLYYDAMGANTGSGSDTAEGATLVVNGSFNANGQFYPDNGYLKGTLYPAVNDINSLGVVVTRDINLNGNRDDVFAGFFYSEGQTNFNRPASFAGTLITGLVNFTMAPNVYQVPNLRYYLPPAIPGGLFYGK
jgi:hypothetical protein